MAIETAKRILSGRLPRAATEGRTLVKVAEIGPGGDAWHACLSDADTDSIIAAIGGLVSPVDPHKHIDAYRDAGRAMVEQKLTERMVAKMEDLERASTTLAERALFIGRVGTVATILGTIAAVVALVR